MKRILVGIMSIVMLVGVLTVGAFAADTVDEAETLVATADELNAALTQGGSIRLTENITLDNNHANSNKITKSVVIDGDGHKITTGVYNFMIARLDGNTDTIEVRFVDVEIDCDAVGVYVYPEISGTTETFDGTLAFEDCKFTNINGKAFYADASTELSVDSCVFEINDLNASGFETDNTTADEVSVSDVIFTTTENVIGELNYGTIIGGAATNVNDSVVTLTFDADGGSCAIHSQTISSEMTISLPDATRSGYVFEGWYNGDDKVEDGANFTADTTLVAKWTVMVATADELNDALMVGGSIRLMDDIILDNSHENSNKITKSVVIDGDGHKITTGVYNFMIARLDGNTDTIEVRFVDVEIDCDAVGVYVYPEISGTTETFDGTLAFEDCKFTNINGKAFYADASTELSVDSCVFEINDLNASGFETDNTTADEVSVSDVIFTTTENVIGELSNGTIIGVAATSVNDSVVTLTFDADGGTCAIHSQTISSEMNYLLPEATRSGYAFDGWYNGDDKVEDGANFTADTTLVAKWTMYSTAPSTYSSIVADMTNGTAVLSSTKSELNTVVTITTIPDEGYEVADVIVIYSSGREVDITDNGDGTYTYRQPGATVTVYVTFAEIEVEETVEEVVITNPFVDVVEDTYYYDAVLWAVGNSITNGTTETTFSPDMTCNRAQAVTLLWKACGSPVVDVINPFTDVDADTYYYQAVLWAVSEGITNGTTATTFSPDADCTRSQIVTFLWNAAGKPVVNYSMTFEDVTSDTWYAEAVRWAVSEGITNGTTATTFSPNVDCTRGQIVTFLYRDMAS